MTPKTLGTPVALYGIIWVISIMGVGLFSLGYWVGKRDMLMGDHVPPRKRLPPARVLKRKQLPAITIDEDGDRIDE